MDIPPAELLRRYSHSEDYHDSDPSFTRSNALSAILERKIVARGMPRAAVKTILGPPDRTASQPAEWIYEQNLVTDNGVRILFNPQGVVQSIQWSFGTADGGIPIYSHEY
jgi:hypothetical protein